MAKENKATAIAADYIERLFKEKLTNKHVYHNYTHTSDVVDACKEIGEAHQLFQEQMDVLNLAAWFHDAGFVNSYDNHEEESINIFREFAKENHLSDEEKDEVERLIRSTQKDHDPQDLLEEIMHDATHIHIGTKSFDRRNELLRTELELIRNEYYSEYDWQQKQLDYLINQNFITRYAQKEYGERRDKNIMDQREMVQKAGEKKTKSQTGKNFGRGIDTLYRTTYRNHISLSQIADGKANMMISVNSIILSVIITLASTGFSMTTDTFVTNLRFIIPIFILLLGSLSSVVFAIISARPKVTNRKVTRDDIENRKASITFFGNFINTPLEEFIDTMDYLKDNQSLLYDSMAIDLYYLGKVLNRKYYLLNISYTLFMAGLVLSVLVFFGVFAYSNL